MLQATDSVRLQYLTQVYGVLSESDRVHLLLAFLGKLDARLAAVEATSWARRIHSRFSWAI